MKQKIKLGVVCLTRNTFDYQSANEIYEKIKNDLKSIENVEWVCIPSPIQESNEAIEVGQTFAKEQVDGIAVISGTFHLGHLVLEIKKYADKPLLLWALPELPYNGGKIRLNSVCGVNLNASNLVKSGINDFTYTVSNSIDVNWVDAIRIIVALKTAHIGIIGYHAHGFYNVATDELALYGKYGVMVDHYELSELFGYKEKEEYKALYRQKLDTYFEKGLPQEKIDKVVSLCAKLRCFCEDKSLTALAIRCWPEFAAGFGIAPCASMSIVSTDDLIIGCEGDVDCTVTMLMHKAVGAVTPFMADLSQVNIVEDNALMWHCGVAPCTLTDGKCKCTLDSYHAGGKGVTAGFVMKCGEINMARLDSVNGKFRLFMEKGTSLPMDKVLSGTYAKVRFATPMNILLDRVIYSGVAHHVSMVYGDYSSAFKIFARLTKTEEI